MKTDEGESCSKNMGNEKDKNIDEESENIKDVKDSETNKDSALKESNDDTLFEPTVDMLVNDFDEEQTLEDEEAMAAKEQVDPGKELSDLQRESEMPIEELLKLYGYGSGPATISSASSSSRKRRKRQDKTPPKTSKKSPQEVPEKSEDSTALSATQEDVVENSGDDDATTTTTATNNLENQSVDDETNFEDEAEPSELKKLYTGIYGNTEKDGELKLDPTASDEEDLDYVPDEDDGKKTIMVGSDYQAVIPEGLLEYDDVLPYENEDKLLWDPSKVNDNEIEDYLNKFSTTSNGGVNHTTPQTTVTKHLRDDEQALLLLVQCGNNCEEALRRRRLGNTMKPTNTMSIWSEEECRNFENGLKMHGKCFHEIQAQKVRTRSVGELVEFYYLWKKTERADLFANKARMDKKKYNLNPCVTDIMDKYLEEYDNGGTNNRERDRSVSPNVNSNSLLQADTKRHRNETSSSSGGNNNQLSQDKLIKQKSVDESTGIKTE
ncbi:hypothetical protein ACKWTF_010008 [Chironomus riparius]